MKKVVKLTQIMGFLGEKFAPPPPPEVHKYSSITNKQLQLAEPEFYNF